MTCEQYDPRLSDCVDGVRDDDIDTHLATCVRCRAVLEELRTVRETARRLEPRVPPTQVWTRIAAQIEQHPRHRWAALAWRPLAAAAALVLVLGGATWLGWQQMNEPPPTAVSAPVPRTEPDPALVQDVETQLKLAEEHYVKAIAGLEVIANAEGSELDQDTTDVLQANLIVIDDAIGESRAALQTDPGSDLAQQSLFEALHSKVTLLQDTIALINEMRKGNQEGAARIVNGLNP